MAKKDIGLNDSNNYKPFPIVIRERGEIGFIFEDKPNPNKNKYEMILYEYIKGKPLRRNKSLGYWTRGSKITFHTALTYYCRDEIEYMLEITYYNDRNLEVIKNVWIKISE